MKYENINVVVEEVMQQELFRAFLAIRGKKTETVAQFPSLAWLGSKPKSSIEHIVCSSLVLGFVAKPAFSSYLRIEDVVVQKGFEPDMIRIYIGAGRLMDQARNGVRGASDLMGAFVESLSGLDKLLFSAFPRSNNAKYAVSVCDSEWRTFRTIATQNDYDVLRAAGLKVSNANIVGVKTVDVAPIDIEYAQQALDLFEKTYGDKADMERYYRYLPSFVAKEFVVGALHYKYWKVERGQIRVSPALRGTLAQVLVV